MSNDKDGNKDYGELDLTAGDIGAFLAAYITETRQGLMQFYYEPDSGTAGAPRVTKLTATSEPLTRAVTFANSMRKIIGREAARELSILALYDLVMLVDNSLSMKMEQEGTRINTLRLTMDMVAQVYSRAALVIAGKKGITAVKSLNTKHDYKVVTPKQINSYFKFLTFEGSTPIGTVLDQKVLKEFVTDSMTRPLLVIIITDGEIEGEPKDRLKNVITRTAAKLSEANKPHGAHAVSYQFAKLGDDSRATKLVKDLDDDNELSPYIDCLLQSKLEDLDKKDKKWHVIHKLLLGAIYPPLDKKNSAADPDYDDQGAVPTLAPVMVQNEDELEEDDEVEDYINEDEFENQDG